MVGKNRDINNKLKENQLELDTFFYFRNQILQNKNNKSQVS